MLVYVVKDAMKEIPALELQCLWVHWLAILGIEKLNITKFLEVDFGIRPSFYKVKYEAFIIIPQTDDDSKWTIGFFNGTKCIKSNFADITSFCDQTMCCFTSIKINNTDIFGFIVDPETPTTSASSSTTTSGSGSSSTTSGNGNNDDNGNFPDFKTIMIGAIVGAVVIVVVGFIMFYCLYWKKRNANAYQPIPIKNCS